jgi:hypothetical protein
MATANPTNTIEESRKNFRIRKQFATNAPVLAPRQLTTVITHNPPTATGLTTHTDAECEGRNALQTCSENTVAIIALAAGFGMTRYIRLNRNPAKSP